MGSIKTDAIVLRYSNFRDHDRMVTLLSPTLGKLDVYARGCRRIKSALLNATEPFCAGEYILNQTRDFYTIAQVAIKDSFYNIRLDYDKLIYGTRLLSISGAISRQGEPAKQPFILLLKALAALCHTDVIPEIVVLRFHMLALKIEGYNPKLELCSRCQCIIDGNARFDIYDEGLLCNTCGENSFIISDIALKWLRNAESMSMEELLDIPVNAGLQEALSIISKYLDSHIDHSKNVK